MQHGSPPAALMAWAAEKIPTQVTDADRACDRRSDAAVPVAPLTLQTEVVREGRKIQLCAVRLLADGAIVVGATVLKIKGQAMSLPPDVADPPFQPLAAQSRGEKVDFSVSPFVTGLSLRAARGQFGVPGRGAIWYRVDRSLVEGCRFAGDARRGRCRFLQRHLGCAGFPAMDVPQRRSHGNYAREPVGDWILLDAESWIGPEGAGLAMAAWPIIGYFGRAVQSLVIEKR